MLVLLVGLACALAVSSYVEATQESREHARFDQAVSQSQESINGMVRTYLALARGTVALFSTDSDVTLEDFDRYAQPLDIRGLYPGIQALGFATYVPDAQVSAFEAKRKLDHQPDFKLWPKLQRDYHLVTTFVTPVEYMHLSPMGNDVPSDDPRFEAIQKAWLTGKPTATKMVSFNQVGKNAPGPGLLMYVPVFRGKPLTKADREKSLIGLVFVALKADRLLNSAKANDSQSQVLFDLYVGTPKQENLISAAPIPTGYRPRYSWTTAVDIGDKNLTLVYHDTPELVETSDLPIGRISFLIGFLLSFLLFFLTLSLSRAREAALQEIVERKSVQSALATSERQMRGVLDALPVGVWLLDQEGNVELSNPAAERLWPDRGEDGFNAKVEGVWVASGEPLKPEEMAAARALGAGAITINDLIDIQLPSGQRKTILNSAVPLKDVGDEITGAVVVSEDISLRRHSEAALLESEERFRAMADSAPVLLWVSGVDGNTTWFNKPWLDYVGRPMELEIGQGWLDSVHPGDLARVREVYEESFKRRVAFELEFRFRRIDGAYRWFLNRGVPRVAPEGTFLGYIGSCLDIEDRRQAEEAMKSINATLERWVEERTRDLRRTIDELESFSYTVAHDLRAPLRAMGGFAQILQEDFKDVMTPEGLGYLRRIRENSGKMAQLIDGLLDLARISRAELHRNEVDLTSVAADVASMLKGRSPERMLEFDIKPNLKAVGDERLLGLVLQNLLENAWKFTAPRERAVIEVGAMPGNPASQGFYVRDNGVGFDMAHASKLFGTFERLHSPGEFPGSGIGLASVKRIIERHGGKVWAEASPGKGATFYFTIGRWPSARQKGPTML